MKAIPLFLFLALGATAVAEPLGSVVKIRSYVCQRPQQFRMGSGVLFEILGKVSVLTSDHTVFPGTKKDGICHTISNEVKEDLPVELRALNFGIGLALLYFTETSDVKSLAAPAVRFDKLREDDPDPKNVILSGFPFSNDTATLVRHRSAEIIASTNNWLQLPLVKHSLVVSGHVFHGMSGGALWSAVGEFLGIISHKYMNEDDAEKIPEIRTYRADIPLANKVMAFVIPNSTIITWIQQVIGHHPESASLYPDLDAELRGSFRVNLDGIVFAAIVRGDGAGIGGDGPKDDDPEIKRSKRKRVEIPLSLEIPAEPVAWPFPTSEKWVKRFKEKLIARNTVVITGFERDDVEYPIYDLMEAFTYLQKGYRPLARITGSPDQNLNEIHRQLLDEATSVSQLAAKLRSQIDKSSGESFLLEAIQIQMEKIQTQHVESVKDSVLIELVEPPPGTLNARAWDALYNNNSNLEVPNKAAKIRELLRRIKRNLSQVRVS